MTFDHEDEAGETPAAAPVTTCERCPTSTRDGKRFCIDHIEAMPYAASVAERWEYAHRVTKHGATVELDLGMPLEGDPSSEDCERTKRELSASRRAAGLVSSRPRAGL